MAEAGTTSEGPASDTLDLASESLTRQSAHSQGTGVRSDRNELFRVRGTTRPTVRTRPPHVRDGTARLKILPDHSSPLRAGLEGRAFQPPFPGPGDCQREDAIIDVTPSPSLSPSFSLPPSPLSLSLSLHLSLSLCIFLSLHLPLSLALSWRKNSPQKPQVNGVWRERRFLTRYAGHGAPRCAVV